jgi:GTP cyclohydrolase I
MISDALDGTAHGFAIMLRGKHLCKSMRGVKNKGEMSTVYFTGDFRKKTQLRNEFYSLVRLQG